MIRLTAGCKANLGLRITKVRADGYHELDSLFYPLAVPCDYLDISLNHEPGIRVLCDLPGLDLAQNTLTRAHALFSAAAGHAPGMTLRLHKGIPSGAGLGGGSSDAAALLLYLNSLADRPLDAASLAQTALKVGADTVFFLQNAPCRVRGIGEELTPVRDTFSDWLLLLICPNLHISTPKAFALWDALHACGPEFGQNSLTKPCDGANGTPLSHAWSVRHIRNDLEDAVFLQYPQLAVLKANILRLGAEGAAMSGSGSSIFGLFRRTAAKEAEYAANALKSADRQVFLIPLGLTGM